MPLTDPQRLSLDAQNPHIVALWRALVPLRSVISFMNTGAHPDDEISEMLAALSFRDGIDISYACSTRGEGGQNDIGRESTEMLGVLRTAEMEVAAQRLNMRMYWLSQTPNDTIFDFGFSKSGEETLAKWGKKRTLKRFVDILRQERPDIICTTFLDVPGQHGHHRAMTAAAEEAFHLAADPYYQYSEFPAWEVAKMYLPAWSGAGQSYDDDLPPPPATITVEGRGIDAVSGAPFERIGELSRSAHATQAMGRWVPSGREKDWPLHLKLNRAAHGAHSLGEGLPNSISDLGTGTGLSDLEHEISAAVTAFPDSEAVLRHASAALKILQNEKGNVEPKFAHKLRRKETQLSKLIRVASGVECNVRLDRDVLKTTDSAYVHSELYSHRAERATVSLALPEGWRNDGDNVYTHNAPVSDAYPDCFLPDEPTRPCVELSLTTHGVQSRTVVPFEVPPQVVPELSITAEPAAVVVNDTAKQQSVQLKLSSTDATGPSPSLNLPEGWHVVETEGGFEVALPANPEPGRYQIGVQVGNTPGQTMRSISFPHVPPRHLVTSTDISVLVVAAGTTPARIGYIGAGNDRVDYWLRALGLDVTTIDLETLENETALDDYDTIVIGIFAMKFCQGLADAMPKLHRWIAAGGNLLTLYHRPWDNWEPETTPPKHLEIGQPSLRWRVTDENAVVKHVAPDHVLLNHPNKILPQDWAGWKKERGLYFAKDWDPSLSPAH